MTTYLDSAVTSLNVNNFVSIINFAQKRSKPAALTLSREGLVGDVNANFVRGYLGEDMFTKKSTITRTTKRNNTGKLSPLGKEVLIEVLKRRGLSPKMTGIEFRDYVVKHPDVLSYPVEAGL